MLPATTRPAYVMYVPAGSLPVKVNENGTASGASGTFAKKGVGDEPRAKEITPGDAWTRERNVLPSGRRHPR